MWTCAEPLDVSIFYFNNTIPSVSLLSQNEAWDAQTCVPSRSVICCLETRLCQHQPEGGDFEQSFFDSADFLTTVFHGERFC
ncbi:hypothetical protein NDU88_011654 [Pleurodeles waltl]|uniref:Uncharacterized protein n=1 Tax=Pleurodeles waltl TaxID=8319 RepID=A0AAV7QZD8_PLEWA|nr:hypothetical protein NDU88_011654 [Pleurodeles waltl]